MWRSSAVLSTCVVCLLHLTATQPTVSLTRPEQNRRLVSNATTSAGADELDCSQSRPPCPFCVRKRSFTVQGVQFNFNEAVKAKREETCLCGAVCSGISVSLQTDDDIPELITVSYGCAEPQSGPLPSFITLP